MQRTGTWLWLAGLGSSAARPKSPRDGTAPS